MPTIEQMQTIWAAEMEFGIGPYYERPFKQLPDYKGEHIGHFEIDPETKDIKIVIDKEDDLDK